MLIIREKINIFQHTFVRILIPFSVLLIILNMIMLCQFSNFNKTLSTIQNLNNMHPISADSNQNQIKCSTDDLVFGDNIRGYGQYIVPNIIHFVRLNVHFFDFVSLITLKSALINHNPDKVYIHCNCESPHGKYWNAVKHERKLIVKQIKMPEKIFGKNLSETWREWHAADIVRLEILKQYGGIYLDNDVYVFKSLNEFRVYEMSIGWEANESIGNQVLIAHRNARFLNMWHKSYHYYDPKQWYFNSGHLPTELLKKYSELVHRVDKSFGISTRYYPLLFEAKQWNNDSYFHTIHLLMNHRYYLDPEYPMISEFNEENIKLYSKKFGELARLMYYGTKDFVL